MITRIAALLFLVTAPLHAQDQEIQKQLIQRQQQSDAFTLQLRQSQERLQVSPSDLKRLHELEARQIGERQRLENLSEKQLREMKPDTPQDLRPIEHQRAADERAPLTVPAGGIIQPVESTR